MVATSNQYPEPPNNHLKVCQDPLYFPGPGARTDDPCQASQDGSIPSPEQTLQSQKLVPDTGGSRNWLKEISGSPHASHQDYPSPSIPEHTPSDLAEEPSHFTGNDAACRTSQDGSNPSPEQTLQSQKLPPETGGSRNWAKEIPSSYHASHQDYPSPSIPELPYYVTPSEVTSSMLTDTDRQEDLITLKNCESTTTYRSRKNSNFENKNYEALKIEQSSEKDVNATSTGQAVTCRNAIGVTLLLVANLLNYMDRYTIAGKWRAC